MQPRTFRFALPIPAVLVLTVSVGAQGGWSPLPPMAERDPVPALGIVVRNLGGRVDRGTLHDKRAAYFMYESSLGADGNGDGDQIDRLVALHTFATGETELLPISGTAQLEVRGPLTAFGVYESHEGQTDFNGDGDTIDTMVHVHDRRTGTTTNTGLSAAFPFAVADEAVAFVVNELSEARDLDGDGSVSSADNVLHLYDVTTESVTNTGLVTTRYHGDSLADDPIASDDLVAFLVREQLGVSDLNADGDSSDAVLHLYDATDASITNLGVAALVAHVERDLVLLLVSEAYQGGVDLSGDGDAGDWVLHRYDVATGQLQNLGVTAFPPDAFCDPKGKIECELRVYCAVTDEAAFLAVAEADNGGDHNGDGDDQDTVLMRLDRATNQTGYLGIALGSGYRSLVARGGVLRFIVSEADQGGTDLNGDGDATDLVLHLYDGSAIENLGLAPGSDAFDHDGELVAVGVSEAAQGGQDLNGDGDAFDLVIHLREPGAARARNLGLASTFQVQVRGALVTFPVVEAHQAAGGIDLNGDGDTSDRVLHAYDARTGRTHAPGIATYDVDVARDAATFTVWESQHGSDLTGDGDTDDLVLFFVGLF